MSETRTAIVTGAASGIGAAIADRLGTDGLRVAGLDLTACRVGADGISLIADVTDPAAVDYAVAEVRRTFGRIDVLVNNAGISGSPEATSCHLTPIEE